MNNVVMAGRFVSDPEVKTVGEDRKVCNFTLAVPRPYKNKEGRHDADFIDCVLWGKPAENTAAFCKKGDNVIVSGRLETELYEKDGQTRKNVQLIGDGIQFLNNRNRNESEELEETNKKELSKSKGR